MKGKINSKYIIAILVNLFAMIACFLFFKNSTFALMISCYILLLSILSCNYRKNIMAISFLICFFVFLIGKPFVMETFGYSRYSAISLNDDSRSVIYICLTVSLISIAIGYCLSSIIKKSKNKNSNDPNMPDNVRVAFVRIVSKYASIALYAMAIIENIARLIVVRQVGYTASYALDFSYDLPFGLHAFVSVAPVALAIFLATLPDRKEVVWPLMAFLVTNVLSSLAGNRFEIISCVLFIVIYGVWRGSIGNTEWIKKKYLVFLVIMAPIIMALLQNITYWRDGLSSSSDIGPIVGFLYGTGGSSELIGAVNQYGDKILDDGTIYSFGGVWRGLNGNIVAQAFGIGDSLTSQTVDYAKNGRSLGSAMTYYFYPKKYLTGYGLGNCYIAELYHDFSMFGVIIGNIIIGIILGNIDGLKKNKILRNFLCVFFIVLLLRLPRDSFDYPLVNLFNLKNLLLVVVIALIAKRLARVNRIKQSAAIYDIHVKKGTESRA